MLADECDCSNTSRVPKGFCKFYAIIFSYQHIKDDQILRNNSFDIYIAKVVFCPDVDRVLIIFRPFVNYLLQFFCDSMVVINDDDIDLHGVIISCSYRDIFVVRYAFFVVCVDVID